MYSILFVDDESEVRSALTRALRREGYEILTAQSGAEALSILDDRAMDIVISDQMMPKMTGEQLVKKIKERYPSVLRIILTGYADFETVKAAINEAEIYRFLTKPWDDDDLRLTLRNAVHRLALERDNDHLKAAVRRHEEHLAEVERLHPGITKVKRDEAGAIIIDDGQ